jgi:hypothetical protein
MRTVYALLALVVLLIGLSFLLPSNTLTGRIITEPPCSGVGCVQLCDVGAEDACSREYVCCPTHWQSGVCDYSFNCEKIREYSLYQSLETYQDSVREQPASVQPDIERFFLPLVGIIVVIAFVIFKYRNPTRELK